jgi:hypothetical protein
VAIFYRCDSHNDIPNHYGGLGEEWMSRKEGLLVLCIGMVLCLCLTPSAIASTEEENNTPVKDAAQLKMEKWEAELGEEGMQEVQEYLELQASLPHVVKASPYSYIAFAATDEESQIAYMTGIDESDLTEEEKEKLKAELQDIWDRYPDGFKIEDNEPLEVIAGIMEQRFIESEESKRDDLDKSVSNEHSSSQFQSNITLLSILVTSLLIVTI